LTAKMSSAPAPATDVTARVRATMSITEPEGPAVAACCLMFAALSRKTGRSDGGDDMRNSAREIGIGASSTVPTVPGSTRAGPCSLSLGGPIGFPRLATRYTSLGGRALLPVQFSSTESAHIRIAACARIAFGLKGRATIPHSVVRSPLRPPPAPRPLVHRVVP